MHLKPSEQGGRGRRWNLDRVVLVSCTGSLGKMEDTMNTSAERIEVWVRMGKGDGRNFNMGRVGEGKPRPGTTVGGAGQPEPGERGEHQGGCRQRLPFPGLASAFIGQYDQY